MNKNLVVILCAGKGTRMNSSLDKVMHSLGGVPIVEHVYEKAIQLDPSHIVQVQRKDMRNLFQFSNEYMKKHGKKFNIVYQDTPLGTGHALFQLEDYYKQDFDTITVLYGDTPFLSVDKIKKLYSLIKVSDADIGVLSVNKSEQTKYFGRIKLSNTKNKDTSLVEQIIEYKDATEIERNITTCNSGIMVIKKDIINNFLKQIPPSPITKEYYLTELINIVRKEGKKVICLNDIEENIIGINSQIELAYAQEIFRRKQNFKLMNEGVQIISPEHTFVQKNCIVNNGTILYPFVYIENGTQIENDVKIMPFSVIQNSKICAKTIIGPFVHIRNNSNIKSSSHIGNFVEIKNSVIDTCSKVKHLSYVGDASVGKNVNVGAGTVFANYDGFDKNKTVVKDGVFIGSNSSLIAPISIEEDSIVAAGSCINKNVPSNNMAIARSKQNNIAQGASAYKSKKRRTKICVE